MGAVQTVTRPTKGCRYVWRSANADRAPRLFAAGDSVPLAELGISEAEAFQFWQAGLFIVDDRPVLAPVQVADDIDKPLAPQPPKPGRRDKR